jgi:hypothetical protein
MSVGGALTPVALRAPSVSAPPTGTFYFAQNRNFLLCLDSLKRLLSQQSEKFLL